MKKQEMNDEVLMDVEDENVVKTEKKSLWKKIREFVRTHKALCAAIGVGAVVAILLAVLKKSDGNDEDLVEAVENSVSASPYDTSNIDDDTLEDIMINAQNAAIEAYNNAVNNAE